MTQFWVQRFFSLNLRACEECLCSVCVCALPSAVDVVQGILHLLILQDFK